MGGGEGEGEKKGQEEGGLYRGLMPDRMHGVTEAMAFIDSYKHME